MKFSGIIARNIIFNRKAFGALVIALILVVTPLCSALASAPPCIKTVGNGYICLTIDDGYNKVLLKKELDLLRTRHIKCTFFVLGCVLNRYPELWRQAIKDGHEICYHSMYHNYLTKMSNAKILADLNAWIAAAKKALGQSYVIPKIVRLPYGSGSKDQRILSFFSSRGYKVINWSMDTMSGTSTYRHSITAYIKSKAKTGAIILTHINKSDVNTMGAYIDWLNNHFKLGRVSDALAAPKPTVKPTPKSTIKPTLKPSPSPKTAT